MKKRREQSKNKKKREQKSPEQQAKRGLRVFEGIFDFTQFVIGTTSGVISAFFRSAASVLKSLGKSSIVFMALSSAIGTVLDYLKIRDLWLLRNKYAKLRVDKETDEQRNLRLEKQIRTTTFTVVSRLAEMGLLIVLSLATLGFISIASPLVLGFAVALGSIGIIKHSYNLIRNVVKRYQAKKELKSLSSPDSKFQFEQKLTLQTQMVNKKYKMIHSAVKLGVAILACATIASVVFFTGPLSVLLIPLALIGVVALTVAYQKVIKPKLKLNEKAQLTQLKKDHEVEFEKWNEENDSIDDRLEQARNFSKRSAARRKGQFDHHADKVKVSKVKKKRNVKKGSKKTRAQKKSVDNDDSDGEGLHR